MTEETQPEWAKKEAVKRLNEEAKRQGGRGLWTENHYKTSAVCAMAEIIAKYEKPPADPYEVLAADVLNEWLGPMYKTKLETFKVNNPHTFSRVVGALKKGVKNVQSA